jgi:succinate dehydrogenase cytochrome b subunit
MSETPSSAQVARWFDPRTHQAGSWAFALHRLSGLGLTFYLGLHLAVLTKLAQGPQVYNNFVILAQSPLIKIGEVILVAGVLFHGLNGVRLILLAFGVGIRQQKSLLAFASLLTIFLSALFAIRMFGE